jgi:hypothetical protein
MSFPEAARSFVAIVEGLGKTLWVLLLGFVAWALSFGNEETLKGFGARLQLAGFTTLKTPIGDVDTRQIGQLKGASQTAAVNAVVLKELASSEGDPTKRKTLEQVASSVTQQQEIQLRVADALADRAQAPTQSAQTSPVAAFYDRWLFVGRHGDGAWKPLSFTLGEAPFPLKPGMRILIKGESLLYADSNCDGKPLGSSNYEATRATTTGLEVLSDQVLCPSVGGATTVWVKVRVPRELFISR